MLCLVLVNRVILNFLCVWTLYHRDTGVQLVQCVSCLVFKAQKQNHKRRNHFSLQWLILTKIMLKSNLISGLHWINIVLVFSVAQIIETLTLRRGSPILLSGEYLCSDFLV